MSLQLLHAHNMHFVALPCTQDAEVTKRLREHVEESEFTSLQTAGADLLAELPQVLPGSQHAS